MQGRGGRALAGGGSRGRGRGRARGRGRGNRQSSQSPYSLFDEATDAGTEMSFLSEAATQMHNFLEAKEDIIRPPNWKLKPQREYADHYSVHFNDTKAAMECAPGLMEHETARFPTRVNEPTAMDLKRAKGEHSAPINDVEGHDIGGAATPRSTENRTPAPYPREQEQPQTTEIKGMHVKNMEALWNHFNETLTQDLLDRYAATIEKEPNHILTEIFNRQFEYRIGSVKTKFQQCSGNQGVIATVYLDEFVLQKEDEDRGIVMYALGRALASNKNKAKGAAFLKVYRVLMSQDVPKEKDIKNLIDPEQVPGVRIFRWPVPGKSAGRQKR